MPSFVSIRVHSWLGRLIRGSGTAQDGCLPSRTARKLQFFGAFGVLGVFRVFGSFGSFGAFGANTSSPFCVLSHSCATNASTAGRGEARKAQFLVPGFWFSEPRSEFGVIGVGRASTRAGSPQIQAHTSRRRSPHRSIRNTPGNSQFVLPSQSSHQLPQWPAMARDARYFPLRFPVPLSEIR
jgi:hypothetical protein